MKANTVTTPTLRLKRSGERAVLIEVQSLGHAFGLRTLLRESAASGIEDVVVTISSVLVIAKSPRHLPGVVQLVRSLTEIPVQTRAGKDLRISVVYDGEDIESLARILGQSSEAFIHWHTQLNWTAAFAGFAPGFVYLISDSGILVPRRDTPRAAVPAGSLAMAESYSAIYPKSSAGGWQLIGRTNAPLWDEMRDDPALIHPGDTIKFESTRELVQLPYSEKASVPVAPGSARSSDLILESPGVLATFQDLGRCGKADVGVGRGGAMDQSAFQLANHLVGNSSDSAALEVSGAGFALRATSDQVLAVSGAASRLLIEPSTQPSEDVTWEPQIEEPFALRAGQRLRIVESNFGSWSYVAARGGFDVPPVLGSRSRNMHSGLGPEPLQAGAELFVSEPNVSMIVDLPVRRRQHIAESVVLRVVPGPRCDWFTAEALETFFGEPWTATHQVSRTAVRLSGTPLERSIQDELPSEGVVRGSIQVPSDGQPLIFGADYPVTGGYPVIGVVVEQDLDKAAQIGPSTIVRFHKVHKADATDMNDK